jgi:tetratricopeptide (TPR) repeat protein
MGIKRVCAVLAALILGLAGASGAAAETQAGPAPAWTGALLSGASVQDKKLIASCDALAAQGKYLSAYDALGPESGDDGFILAKRLELCRLYYVQSLQHRLFALVDLVDGGSLDTLREGGGSFTMVASDPAAKAEAYLSAHPKSPIVAKALGDFYFDVYQRYGGKWTESEASILAKCVANYEKAFALGLSDAASLGSCAEAYLRQGADDKAISTYELAIAAGGASLGSKGDAHYNLAFACLRKGDAARALAEAKKAVELYADSPDYRFEACLLGADAAKAGRDYKGALAMLAEARKISDEDYRLYEKTLPIYLALGDFASALGEAQDLFALAPRNPQAAQMVMDAYYGAKLYDQLAAFFEWGVKSYFKDDSALGNLYYHYSQLAHDTKDDALARSLIDKAEKAFKKAGGTGKEVFDAIARQRAVYGE